jgi:hypothetical protein
MAQPMIAGPNVRTLPAAIIAMCCAGPFVASGRVAQEAVPEAHALPEVELSWASADPFSY